MLETQRLVVRSWEASDEADLIAIVNSPSVQKWLPDWEEPEKWIGGWIQNVKRHEAQDDPLNKFISWAIVLKDTGVLVGQINIGADAFENKEMEVAYFIGDAYAGNGYATEAATATIAHVFEKYKQPILNAMVQPENLASIAVIKKTGFRYVKTEEIQLEGLSRPEKFDYYILDNPAL